MANFTLDDIRTAAEAKYGSTDIELGDGMVVKLVNPLRLPKLRRDALMNIQGDLNAEGEDAKGQEEILAEAIRLVAEKPVQAEALLEAVGDDLTVLAEIFERYTKSTQVGEASASQD